MFGLLGAYIVRENLNKPAAASIAEKKSVIVPRASADLLAGRKVTMGDILIYQMTAADMKKAGIDKAFMGDTRQIIGRTLKADLKSGSTFAADLFYAEGTGPNVAELLEPGERAITVPVETDSAVAGFTRPGTWVDVIFTSEENEEYERPATTITLLEHVKVLAFNQQTFENATTSDNTRNDEAAVTLAVNVEDAAALRVVHGHGTLSLVLRNAEDTLTTAALAPRTLDELLKIPPSQKHRMEIFRGNQMSQTEFRRNRRTEAPVLAIADDNTAKGRAASNPPVEKN